MDWYNPSSNIYKQACHIVNRLMPSYLKSLFDSEDFVMDAIMELLKQEGSGSELLVIVSKRRMLDAARCRRNKGARLRVDVPTRSVKDWKEDLEGIADLELRLILEKRLEGYGPAEIGVMMGVTTRTVQRRIRGLKKTMKKLQ